MEQKEEAITRGGENEALEQNRRLKDAEQFHLIWFEPEEDKGIGIIKDAALYSEH